MGYKLSKKKWKNEGNVGSHGKALYCFDIRDKNRQETARKLKFATIVF